MTSTSDLEPVAVDADDTISVSTRYMEKLESELHTMRTAGIIEREPPMSSALEIDRGDRRHNNRVGKIKVRTDSLTTPFAPNALPAAPTVGYKGNPAANRPLPGAPPPVPLMQRTGCAWAVSTEAGAHLFCDMPTERGNYCRDHRAMMFTKPEARK